MARWMANTSRYLMREHLSIAIANLLRNFKNAISHAKCELAIHDPDKAKKELECSLVSYPAICSQVERSMLSSHQQ